MKEKDKPMIELRERTPIDADKIKTLEDVKLILKLMDLYVENHVKEQIKHLLKESK